MYLAQLKKFEVPGELYVYEKGGHGFGMINKTSDVKWTDLLTKWMQQMKIIL